MSTTVDPTDLAAWLRYFFPTHLIDTFLQDSHCAGHVFASVTHLLLVAVRVCTIFVSPIVGIGFIIKLWESNSKDGNGPAVAFGMFAGVATFVLLQAGVAYFWAPFFTRVAAAHEATECHQVFGLFWMAAAPLWAVLTSKIVWAVVVVYGLRSACSK